jgi:hypothetical protein
LNLIVGMLRRPRRALEELGLDESGYRRAFVLMVLLAVAYTVVDFLLAVGEVEPIPEPFLRIPSDQYYARSWPFYGVTFLGGWLLASAVMQLAARAVGGTGQFEKLVAATGVATVVATLPTLIPDLITSSLGIYDTWAASGLVRFVPWLYMGLYLVLFLVYYPLAVAVVHRVSRGRAILVGVFGYVVYQSVLFIFIR